MLVQLFNWEHLRICTRDLCLCSSHNNLHDQKRIVQSNGWKSPYDYSRISAIRVGDLWDIFICWIFIGFNWNYTHNIKQIATTRFQGLSYANREIGNLLKGINKSIASLSSLQRTNLPFHWKNPKNQSLWARTLHNSNSQHKWFHSHYIPKHYQCIGFCRGDIHGSPVLLLPHVVESENE